MKPRNSVNPHLISGDRRDANLERRFLSATAKKGVRWLYELLDVDISYQGFDAPADGDVLTYIGDDETWQPRPPTEHGLPCIRVSTVYDDGWGEWTAQWNEGGMADVGGISPEVPFTSLTAGVWHVTVTAISQDIYPTVLSVGFSAEAPALPSGPWGQQARLQVDSVAEFVEGQGSLDVWLAAGKGPVVWLSTSATVDLAVTAHLVRQFPLGAPGPGGPGGET